MFGRKKKDEKEGDTTEDVSTSASGSTAIAPAMSTPIQAPSVPAGSPTPTNFPPLSATSSYQPPRGTPPSTQVDEDSSLSRLLQSLLKDLPSDASSFAGEQPRGFAMQSSPEWVPPRSTPTSRPMTIFPGGKKGSEPDKPSMAPPPPPPPARSMKPPDSVEQPGKETIQPKFYPPPSTDRSEKPAREEVPKRPSAPRVSQSFDHIFELTQGSFESPGLVVVNGSPGSGKTTLCSGLASSFLKQGNPCMFVTYDKAPTALREQMKKIGADPSEAESQYRFLLVDGFSSQSDSFSFEPYYVEKAFDFDSIQDALVKNSSMFIGEKTKILFDSIDPVVAKVASKDLVKRLGETLDKLRDSNVTLVLTVDLAKATKDLVKWLEDTASCVIDLDKDDSDPNGRELKVRKLNGSASKLDTETFEIDSSKGLVFVK